MMAEAKNQKKKTSQPKEKAAPKKRKSKSSEVVIEVAAEAVVAPSAPLKPVVETAATPVVEKFVEAAAPIIMVKPVKKKRNRPAAGVPKYAGTGRRKEARAKVWLTPGTGKYFVNGKSLEQYFCGRKILEYRINRPLITGQLAGKYDVYAELSGGGIPGQADALSLGIARAMLEINPEIKATLKRVGLLTRDPRMKERKKYGLKRARRAFQYTKR